MAIFHIGDLVTFQYPLIPQTRAHDKYPKILVLHDNWQGLTHGINFNYLTNEEINTIRAILDPFFEQKYREALSQKNPEAFKELESIITSSGNPKVTSPRDFYGRVIRPFIMARGWDPYRLYRPELMSGIRILQKEYHMTGKDSHEKFKQQQKQALDKASDEDKAGVMQWFKDKFSGMRGPQMATRTPSFFEPLYPEQELPNDKRGAFAKSEGFSKAGFSKAGFTKSGFTKAGFNSKGFKK
jgi:hypothetical protein